MASGSPSDVARLVLDLALARPPTLGSGRLVCIDGPAGSGKSTLADALVGLEPAGRVVHMDDLYDGWEGLARVTDQLAGLLLPLAEGRPGSYRRYDWHAKAYAETVTVEPVPLLVVEGVGSAAAAYSALATVVVWVEAPREQRLRRGLERDGEGMRADWERWMADEDRLFAAEDTRRRAHVLVDGTGERPPTLRTSVE